MRTHLTKIFVFFICSWVSVLSYSASIPEDLDSSGDDLEFSGSGSGLGQDDLANNKEGLVTVSNVTEARWTTDAPVRVTQQTTLKISEAPSRPPTSPLLFPGTTLTPPVKTSDSNALPYHTTSFHHYNIMEEENTTTPSRAVLVSTSSALKEMTTAQPTLYKPPRSEEAITVVFTAEEYSTASVALTQESTTVVTTTVEEAIVDFEDEVEDNAIPTPVIAEEEDGTTVPEDRWVHAVTSTLSVNTTPLSTTTDSADDIIAEWEESGDDVVSTTPNEDVIPNFVEDNIIPDVRSGVDMAKPDDDFGFDNDIRRTNIQHALESSSDNILERKEVLAGVIAGGLVGLALAVMLVALMVYRMKKKDEGSYALDDHRSSTGGYQKAHRQEEFLA